MPCSILELQHVDEMRKRQNTKGNVEMKDLVLGKNDTDNLCIFDKKWEWTLRTFTRSYFGAPSPLNRFMRLNIYNKTMLKRERRKCHASRARVERNTIGYYNKSLDKWKNQSEGGEHRYFGAKAHMQIFPQRRPDMFDWLQTKMCRAARQLYYGLNI